MSRNKEKDLAIIMTLLHNGVNYVGINYSGGGDSGAIDELFLFNKLDEEFIQNGEIPNDISYNKKNYPNTVIVDDKDFNNDAIENLFFPHLDQIEDWWNNDGGYGSAVLDLQRMMLQIDNHTYYTQVNDHSHSIEV